MGTFFGAPVVLPDRGIMHGRLYPLGQSRETHKDGEEVPRSSQLGFCLIPQPLYNKGAFVSEELPVTPPDLSIFFIPLAPLRNKGVQGRRHW